MSTKYWLILKQNLSHLNKDNKDDEMYDLVANIVHDGDPKEGTYRIHVLHTETGTWKQIEVK